MDTEKVIQGRRVTCEDVALVGSLLDANPSWHRTRLSRELCTRWEWRNGMGRLKDMACRTLLLKLERMGEVELPPRQAGRSNQRGYRPVAEMLHDQSPIRDDLKNLRPLRIVPIGESGIEMQLFKFLLQRYHYLGYRTCVGENLKYWVCDANERPLACLLFSAAAWKVKVRDSFIGWNSAQREAQLYLLSNNSRFLILPWVRVSHLASHVLAQVRGRISTDWTIKYGHPIYLLETFVERQRFQGSCYRAAGWIHGGATTGRSRNDKDFTLSVPVKEVYLQPLIADFRQRLCA